jgi:catechol 2,3-dioxygenase-like lactoylglutathione lyase family enzyme
MTDTVTLRNPAIRLKAAVPTFLVADVGATARWYTETLGFRTAGTVPPREPPDLAPRRPAGAWDAYVRMQGVHAFYDSVRGQPFIRTALKKQPYGDWEFEVRDPNGYILVFSELTD